MTTVIVIVAIAAIIALVLIARDGGPRVTTIERKTERKDEDEDSGDA